jgi:hypothetical protein
MLIEKKKPGGLLFVAIVLIILGGLALLSGVVSGGMNAIYAFQEPAPGPIRPGDGAAIQRFFAKEVPGYTAFLFVGIVLGLVFGGGQLAAGIGLLKLKLWARTLAICLTLVKVLVLFIEVGYSVALVLPAQQKFFEQNPIVPAGGPAPPFDVVMFAQVFAYILLAGMVAVQLTLAGLILIFLNTASTKAALTGQPVKSLSADDEEKGEEKPHARYEGYDEEG